MQRLVIAVFAVTFIDGVSFPIAFPQDDGKTLASFIITVETTSTNVSLTCEKGCEWVTLWFPLGSTPTLVDRKGIVNDKGGESRMRGGFLLGVGANGGVNDKGMDLTCERGCVWKAYAFTPRSVPWVIDECAATPKKLWKPPDLNIPCADRHAKR